MAGIVPVAIGIGIIALLANLLSGDKEAKASTSPTGPSEPNEPTPEDLQQVESSLSDRVKAKLQEYDNTQNADVIKEAATIAANEGQTAQANALQNVYESKKVLDDSTVFASPISNLKPDFWTRFVNCIKGNNPKLITSGFALGLFGFGARRLVDLGLMTNPHQGDYKGKTVWTGNWTPPLNINKFLSDSALQYKAFFASMRDYAQKIKNDTAVQAFIGQSIDGKPISLSGILGVAHRAGWSGMKKWFTTPSDRTKFTATTEAFNKCNGIF